MEKTEREKINGKLDSLRIEIRSLRKYQGSINPSLSIHKDLKKKIDRLSDEINRLTTLKCALN